LSNHQDQADTLRRLMQERGEQRDRNHDAHHPMHDDRAPSARVITVASGKGGVGKSCLTANLGAWLARSGLRVLLVDGDTGLANLDILLGLAPEHRATLEQVLEGRARIQDAIVGVEPNLWLIPAAAGLQEMRHGGPESRLRLMEVFESCPWEMDVILVDAGAGIGPHVLSLHSPAFDSLVVLTPEPTSLSDAYSLIKMARWNAGVRKVGIVVNQSVDGRQGQAVFQKLKDIAARFLDVELEYIGHWVKDEKITQSVMKRKILLDLEGGAPSLASLELLGKRISAKSQAVPANQVLRSDSWSARTQGMHAGAVKTGNTAGFWRTLLGEVKT
jgi:flagellar biosynthesis protein FlhG